MKKEQTFYFLSWLESNGCGVQRVDFEDYRQFKKKIKQLKADPNIKYIRAETRYHWYRPGDN